MELPRPRDEGEEVQWSDGEGDDDDDDDDDDSDDDDDADDIADDDDDEAMNHEQDETERARRPLLSRNNGLFPLHDPSMILTDLERTWAEALRQAVQESNNNNNNNDDDDDDDDMKLDTLTDMEYAQFAIITQGNRQEALRRMASLQCFRRTYNIDNTIDQGVFYINALMELQPGFVLNLNVDLTRQESINAFDCGKFQPKIALGCCTTPNNSEGDKETRAAIYNYGGKILDNWQICICGIYYLKYSCQPSLAVIRNGFLELIDFSGYEWENFSLEAQERLFGELLRDYPMTEKHLLAYNTGYVANVGFGLAKKFLPAHMRDSIQLGCQVMENDESRNPTKRLAEFYLQPSREVAEQNLLERVKLLIAMRHHNESLFRL